MGFTVFYLSKLCFFLLKDCEYLIREDMITTTLEKTIFLYLLSVAHNIIMKIWPERHTLLK